MREDVTEVINGWNPVDIHPLLKSEYQYEIKRITEEIKPAQSTDAIASVIYRVFKDSFGSQFSKPLKECEKIARKLAPL